MAILGPKTLRFPIGISDFARLRRENYTYVDKTTFVAEIIDSSAVSLLFPRPRRFGKTLNMSTLRYFFERSDEDRSELFADTYIWTAKNGDYRKHFQRYPVVWLTFKDVKANDWPATWSLMRDLIQEEVSRLWTAYQLENILPKDSLAYARYLRMMKPDATPDDLNGMLALLTEWLSTATGERVVILIDEYDAALHAAWQHGYWEDALSFFRTFLSAGLKDQPQLFRGILTGILKIAKENIFSGLNNLKPYSILTPTMATDFGFTEAEVIELASAAHVLGELEELRRWYNGYRFGGTKPVTMYNPWSILMYLSEPSGGMRAFWKNTSSNDLIRNTLIRHAATVGPDIEKLIRGETIEKTIDESIVLSDLDRIPNVVWSLLTFSGYLSADSASPNEMGLTVQLRIPNGEVLGIYRTVFADYLTRSTTGGAVDELLTAMLHGDVDSFAANLEELLLTAISFYDFVAKPVEAVYQAFILGLLVHLDRSHRVVSNREAGRGRADVLITPREPKNTGAVLELKVVTRRETPEQAMQRAIEQLRTQDYAAEVRASGASEVFQYAVVFDGKRCGVERV